jgi:hypothetical protein
MKPGTTHRHRDKSGAKHAKDDMIRHSTFSIRQFSTPLSPHTPSHPVSDARPGPLRPGTVERDFLAPK